MDEGTEYYTSRKQELLAEFAEDALYWRRAIASRDGEDLADAIVTECRQAFEALLPEIPYIGGDENRLTAELVRAARCLALYKAMKRRGKTPSQAGKVLYDAVELRGGCPSPPIPPSRWLSPEELMARRRERAELSQKRRYPGDWVYSFVAGDGETFDYGDDFVECAAQKLYRAQGAEEFLPFYCFLDFPISRAAGLGLSRTMTLAEGHEKCNHRFKKGSRVEREWPPPFLAGE